MFAKALWCLWLTQLAGHRSKIPQRANISPSYEHWLEEWKFFSKLSHTNFITYPHRCYLHPVSNRVETSRIVPLKGLLSLQRSHMTVNIHPAALAESISYNPFVTPRL